MNLPEHSSSRSGFLALTLASLALLSGCLGREQAVTEVDVEAYDIVGARAETMHGSSHPL